VAGFASPDRLRLQVFSTSWRFHPPRACRPCFMPDPLMGLRPSELCSSHAAVHRLRRPSPHDVRQQSSTLPPLRNDGRNRRTSWANGRAPRAFPPSGVCSARESATRHRRLNRRPARSSPGLPPSRVLSLAGPAGFRRPSPHGLGSTDASVRTSCPTGCSPNEIGWSLSRLPTLLGFPAL
jgi:hypothetical protein